MALPHLAGEVIDRLAVAEGNQVLAEGYRLWWYHSTRKADHDLASRSNRLDRAVRHLRQVQAKLRGPRARLRDRAKVQQHLEQILQHYEVAGLVRVAVVERPQETYHQRRRGRPGLNTEYVIGNNARELCGKSAIPVERCGNDRRTCAGRSRSPPGP